ncbi:MAG: cation:proton antiporter [Gammaproteobacteria bacterium]|nr:cation:proton antiporter [Gammaproteobacteria bacterium]
MHADPGSSIIFWGTLILFFGIIGRYLAKCLDQPGVLGELLMGVIVGNVCYYAGIQLMVILRDGGAVSEVIRHVLKGVPLKTAVYDSIHNFTYAKEVIEALSGPNGQQWINVSAVVDAFSSYGVIFLLFMVGLESSLTELKKTGKAATKVAVIGVIAPIVLGILVTEWLLPEAKFSTALFVAATLCATSVGITVRVLQDMKKLKTEEAKTILGAAMIDDVLGLIILAVVSGMVVMGAVNVWTIGRIFFMAVIFFPLSLWLGPMLLRKMIGWMTFVDHWEAKLLTSFMFLMCFSWLATLVHMSTIIGAFMAGIIIHEGFFEPRERELKDPQSIRNLLAPFEAIFAPLFFMLIGIQVKLESFLDKQVILFSICLLLVAVIGKVVSGLGGNRRDDRLLIGMGMVPRGEVGLVFASVGKGLGVIPDTLFSAIIVMVVVTTFMTPLCMKFRYHTRKKKAVAE